MAQVSFQGISFSLLPIPYHLLTMCPVYFVNILPGLYLLSLSHEGERNVGEKEVLFSAPKGYPLFYSLRRVKVWARKVGAKGYIKAGKPIGD
jgi:hypothetical protein